MDGLPSVKKQRTEPIRPSRLRHECRLESIDDEQVTEGHPLQATDSHGNSLITQFVDDADVFHGGGDDSDYGEPDLSPVTAATLERLALKKTPEADTSSQFAVRFLTKEDFEANTSSLTFSFENIGKVNAKTNLEKVDSTPQSGDGVADTSLNDNTLHSALEDDAAALRTKIAKITEIRSPDQHLELLKPTSNQENTTGISTSYEVDKNEAPALPDFSTSTPPSAQPSTSSKHPRDAQERPSFLKARKKSRGIVQSRRGAQWPPITHGSTNEISPSLTEKRSKSADSSNILMASPVGKLDDDSDACSHHQVDQRYNLETHLDDETQPFQVSENVSKLPISPRTGNIDQPCTEKSSSEVCGEVGRVSPKDVPYRQPEQTSSPQIAQRPCLKEPYNREDSQLMTISQHNEATAAGCFIQNMGGNDLQTVHSPPKTVKRSAKKRVIHGAEMINASTAIQSRVPKAPNGFEHVLDALRVTHLAEQYRESHAHSLETRHLHEAKEMLQDQIKLQISIISEWKSKYDKLQGQVVHIRERAKTNQTYVVGLQKDYEKLQKTALIYQNDCKKTLREKIAEIESDRTDLIRDFEVTLSSIENSQRSFKRVVEDLQARLILSQAENKSLYQDLQKQIVLYTDEKDKRNNLEKEMAGSLQSMQSSIKDISVSTTNNFDAIKSAIDHFQSRNESTVGMGDCLGELKELSDTARLTRKDVTEAQNVFCSMNHDVRSKLDTLTSLLESRPFPEEDAKKYLQDGLQALQSEVRNYGEMAATRDQLQNLNGHLSQQLEGERKEVQHLNQDLRSLSIENEDLKTQYAGLEVERNKLLNGSRINALELDELKEDFANVQIQLNEVDHKFEAAQTEARELKRLQQEAIQDAAMQKERCQDLEAKLMLRQTALSVVKDLQEKTDESEIRKNIESTLRTEFTKLESDLESEIQRLTMDCTDKDAVIQMQNHKWAQASATLEEHQHGVKQLHQDLAATRNENQELQTKLMDAQNTIAGFGSLSSEISSLRDCLQQRSDELAKRNGAYNSLAHDHAHLQTVITNLQVLCEQLQAENVQQNAEHDSLHQEAEAELLKVRTDLQRKIADEAERVIMLQKEKDELHSKLGQIEANEKALHDNQSTLRVERDNMNMLLAKAEAAKQEIEEQLLRDRENAAEKVHNVEATNEDLQHRLRRCEATLKEAEAKNRLEGAEHRKKLDFDRIKYEDIISALEKAPCVKCRATTGTDPQPSTSKLHISLPITSLKDAKGRRKVNRNNSSVLNVNATSELITRESSQESDGKIDHDQNLFEEDYGLSIVDPALQSVEDTQQVETENCTTIETRSGHGNRWDLTERISSSGNGSDLSPHSSDGLDFVKDYQQQAEGFVLRGLDDDEVQNLCVQQSSEDPILSKISSPPSIQSCGRPRSKANTASRMMPPLSTDSRNVRQATQEQPSGPKHNTFRGKTGSANKRKMSNSPSLAESKGGNTGRLQKTRKLAPGKHNAVPSNESTSPEHSSQPQGKSDLTSRETRKRQPSRSKASASSFYGGSARQTRSKTQEDRFNQELQGL